MSRLTTSRKAKAFRSPAHWGLLRHLRHQFWVYRTNLELCVRKSVNDIKNPSVHNIVRLVRHRASSTMAEIHYRTTFKLAQLVD